MLGSQTKLSPSLYLFQNQSGSSGYRWWALTILNVSYILFMLKSILSSTQILLVFIKSTLQYNNFDICTLAFPLCHPNLISVVCIKSKFHKTTSFIKLLIFSVWSSKCWPKYGLTLSNIQILCKVIVSNIFSRKVHKYLQCLEFIGGSWNNMLRGSS